MGRANRNEIVAATIQKCKLSVRFQTENSTPNLPIGSMYAIYGNIYHQYTPNVSIYIPYMDPMGYGS